MIRRNYKKTLIFSVILSLLFFAAPVMAQSLADISFGIRPTTAQEGQEETFSYFSYRVSPGSVFDDAALVLNDGDTPVTLKLYAADGITSQNGGTDFTEYGQPSEGMSSGSSSWITLSANEIFLNPGEEQVVPFQVNIPAGVNSGQYVAGLVVEAAPEMINIDSNSVDDASQLVVETIRRVGVAIVMDIPGEQFAGLEIKNISLYQQSEEGTTFAVEVQNTGNIFLQAKGFFIVTDRNAERVITTTPLEFDTVLPGDTVTFYVPRAARFADGKYLLSIVLEYEGQRATLEGIGMNIKNGQPQLEGQITENIFTPEEIEVFFEKAEKDSSFTWLIIAGISFFLALALGGFVYWAGGKKKETV